MAAYIFFLMPNRENTPQTAAEECERIIPFFIENLNARDCRETILHFLKGGHMHELAANQVQSLAWALDLMNSIADVQQTQTVHSCTLKIA
jgi:hypothetical protein